MHVLYIQICILEIPNYWQKSEKKEKKIMYNFLVLHKNLSFLKALFNDLNFLLL